LTVATPSEVIEIDVVNQIIDLNANSSYEAFRFEPDYLWLKPGTVVRFKGSTGRHTVSSVRGMYPKGARPFEIRGRAKMDIPFDQEGVYGIRCRVHGRHGMAMLIIVGDPKVNLEKARVQKVGKKEAVKFKALFERLDKDIAVGS
jgi:pseudoazurin